MITWVMCACGGKDRCTGVEPALETVAGPVPILSVGLSGSPSAA